MIIFHLVTMVTEVRVDAVTSLIEEKQQKSAGIYPWLPSYQGYREKG